MTAIRAASARTFRPWLLASCLLLGACTVLPDKPQRAVVYDFGPGARATPAAPADTRPPPILLGEVEAARALDSTALLYRLAYADAQMLQPYALARWSMPPAQLLRQRLHEVLGQRQPVLRDGDGLRPGGRPARHLQLELHEFSQVFDAPGTSVGLVRVLATVAGPGADGAPMLAQRSFVAQQPAPSPDAAGGVRALTAASDVVLSDITQWLSALR
ncbi:ABC-type transport auxiliary lipoprotein family protein [Comamonadaceae bacterium G21597-S1]|nr:ABC-type transport auxiliary lipoprotein family protein [Comamonadaceae bacterium G21597-S1]